MPAYHLILRDKRSAAPRRVDFDASSPDHVFQIARNESDGVDVELWEGGTCLARMTKSHANLWKLHRHAFPEKGAKHGMPRIEGGSLAR